MTSILDKIVATKRAEIEASKSAREIVPLIEAAHRAAPALDFLGALKANPFVGLIAEVKKASPSKGIIREDFDPVKIAASYASAGADCISVLTDGPYFQGSLEYLERVRRAVDTPLLRKDFILDPYQVYEARASGADAVLLIAECLPAEELLALNALVVEFGMTPLIELYEESNIDKVLACEPKLVGVNNRDLNTFEVDIQHSIRVKQMLPQDIVMVSESGIFSPQDVKLLHANGVDAMLVGESLMRAEDIGAAVKQLIDR
jgi:indole-3-glycerol phosphate synthase